ncbi:MAG: TIM barrel protein, partial [Lachnospiraceae bacterium]|nr:TIM barrel protein [Lachnospiraceae bacterium]
MDNINNKQIRFGPAGNSEQFYNEGHKSSVEAPRWIHEQGLNAFEYSFGRGIKIPEDMAVQLGKNAKEYGVAMSVQAPYYINLATFDEQKIESGQRYLLQTFKMAKLMGASRVTLHPGSCAKTDRKKAFEQNLKSFANVFKLLCEMGYGDITLCPETMGKLNQLGDVDEIILMANVDERIIPTIDFGHINARTMGGLATQEDYKILFDTLENGIGKERLDSLHCHFSRIEFTEKGEKCHLTYDDTRFGPDFEPLAKELI